MTGLEQRLRSSLIGARPPGLAAAIVRPESTVTAAVGAADIAGKIAASPQMICPWFSMTKIATATVALRLVERGLLDLDAPLAPHVPQFARLRPVTAGRQISAYHLLTHSAGLANPIPVRWIHPAAEPAADQDALLNGLLARHGRLRFTPGTRASYSNIGFLGLGVALTHLTGTPLPQLVERELLRPLTMGQTGFTYTEPMSARAATGYHRRWSPLRLLLPRWVIGPATDGWVSLRPFLLDGQAYGGLVGPLEDAARFLRMHLRDGELDGIRVLSSETAQRMRRIAVRGRRIDLGLWWFRPAAHRADHPPFVQHLGGGAGFLNLLRIYPTRGVGIAVMGNATSFDIDAIGALALSALE